MTTLLIDADPCPVKEEAYKVADGHGAAVAVVSNSWIRVPTHLSITLQALDAAIVRARRG